VQQPRSKFLVFHVAVENFCKSKELGDRSLPDVSLAPCSYCRIIRRDKPELSARSFSDCPFSCQSRMLRSFALSRFPDLRLDGP